MNMKFGIGVVVAIVMQVSAFVWWTAQQAQTIETLKGQVSELTSKMAVEDEVNMARDIADMKKSIEEQYMWLTEIDKDIEDLIDFAEFTENKWANAYDEDPGYDRIFGKKPAPAK
jgi:membrane-associated HD superfamily phosphohydrolase